MDEVFAKAISDQEKYDKVVKEIFDQPKIVATILRLVVRAIRGGMYMKTRSLAAVLAAFVLVTSAPALTMAAEVTKSETRNEDGSITYRYKSGTTVTIRNKANGTSIIAINGKKTMWTVKTAANGRGRVTSADAAPGSRQIRITATTPNGVAVKSVERGAISGSKAETIKVSIPTVNTGAIVNTKAVTLDLAGVKVLKPAALKGNKKVTTVKLDSNITSIGKGNFTSIAKNATIRVKASKSAFQSIRKKIEASGIGKNMKVVRA